MFFHEGDDVGALRADVLRKMAVAERDVFEQLEALLGHYQVDGINRIDLAHRLTRRASQIDGVGEWGPMVYRIANCWRKCSNLHKAGRVGDASGFMGFFVYKLRGMDSEYVAQAGEIDAGRNKYGGADSVALAKQIEQALVPAKQRSKPALVSAVKSASKNSLTQQPPSEAERAAFMAVRQSLLNDEGLKHLAELLTSIKLIASDGVQFVVRASDMSEAGLSSATLEIILSHRLESVLGVGADTLDMRAVE